MIPGQTLGKTRLGRPERILDRVDKVFKGASGQALQSQGKFRFKVQIGNKVLDHNFFVIKGLNESVILGINFIQKHQLTYNPKHWSFS
jgi:hypothetical protein